MAMWKMPPSAKIYEALTAVVDDRVKITSATSAKVTSSTGLKGYTVEWSDDFEKIASNDNASYWQGYMGYPIVAVLLKTGRVLYTPEVAQALAGIEWKTLNQKHKNKYDKAIQEVLDSLPTEGITAESVRGEVENILMQLSHIELGQLPKRKAPPKD